MRIKQLPVIPILVFALAGCLKEDLSGCYDEQNVTFVFQYEGAGNSVFTDYINQVDLFLFDGDGKFMSHRKAGTAELSVATPGMTFLLPPGTYYAVAWGNAGSNSRFSELIQGVTRFDDFLIEIDPASTRTGDRWYYAPYKKHPQARNVRAVEDMALYKVVVPETDGVVKIMEFARAHRSIYVWVREIQDEHRLPEIEARQLWRKYDSYLQTQTDRREFRQPTVTYSMNGTVYSLAVFHHAYGTIDNAIDVQIYRSAYGMQNFEMDVKQFLTDNPEADTDDIQIVVSFAPENLGVTVSLPEWVAIPVQPDID